MTLSVFSLSFFLAVIKNPAMTMFEDSIVEDSSESQG